jgi:integrase
MPRPSKGPHLYLYKRKGRAPVWVIRDGSREVGTGCAESNRAGAEQALARYLNEKHQPQPAGRDTAIADILLMYAHGHAEHGPSSGLFQFHLRALEPFWGDKTLSDVSAASCRAYAAQRCQKVTAATARRELETLNAAIRWCNRREGTPLALLTFPERSPPRERWLTRPEGARLLWAAWKAGNRHLARFILLGLYTGTRHGAILKLQWHANTVGGWIDLDGDPPVLYRRGTAQRETRKRQPPARLHKKLIPHLRRWRLLDSSIGHVVHWHGASIAKERRAWDRAVREAGLGREVTPHTLRHTCATWMMQRGVPIWEAAGYLGMSAKMLEAVYGHHSPDFQRKAAGHG